MQNNGSRAEHRIHSPSRNILYSLPGVSFLGLDEKVLKLSKLVANPLGQVNDNISSDYIKRHTVFTIGGVAAQLLNRFATSPYLLFLLNITPRVGG